MVTNTGIGVGIGIPFRNNAHGGDKPYLPPEIKDSLKAIVIAYGKSNDDADRSIVKNLVDASNPFIISNAAFKLNSGFGKYEVDFTSWIQTNGVIASSDKVQNSIIGRFLYFNTVNKKEDVPSFKVNITLGQQGKLQYNYIKEDGTSKYIVYSESGIYTIPASYFSKYTGGNAWFGFYQIEGTSIIEQIPSFEGAFVTDGVNDLITSTKTVQEMLGGSNEITVVSMIHQIGLGCRTNFICDKGSCWCCNEVANTGEGKTGIYGYSSTNISVNTPNIINNVLGDKVDYSVTGDRNDLTPSQFSVVGYISSSGKISYTSSVAWYWTIIANKVLTTDEINQVIAYYNLDRTLKPDILCNTIKQGITNENHAEFGDKLIDFSGNGRDIQLNNLAWKGGSGIAAKPFETIKDYTIVSDEARQKLTIYNEFSYKVKSNTPNHYWTVQSIIKDNTSYQVTIITDKDCYWINSTSFTNNEGNKESIIKKYPVQANTPTQVIICGLDQFEYPEGIKPTTAVSYVNLNYAGEVTVTFIPSHKGGLLLDGVNDFGKVTGMPIYKDYTIVVDYERISGIEQAWAEALISKSYMANQGAFVLMETNGTAKHSYSFGAHTTFNKDDSTRTLLYQSKYKCGDVDLNVGTGIDGDTLWLGTYRDNYSSFFNGVIYSLMSFPYSMSEFLIERQLKKYKLGTLYPDMVEFRPIVKSNSEYQVVDCYIDTFPAVVGNYYPINSKLRIAVTTKGKADEVISLTVNGVSLGTPSVNGNRFTFNSTLSDKSPQKINITIDEYIRYEDIVQPYPVIFQITDRNTNQRYSWGDKIKVGSSIQLSQGEKPNLLSGLYSIQSYEYEGKKYSYNQLTNLNIILTKQSISLSCNKIWLLDDNEPKCILSPRLLRIPNSSYKILGHIPDISGHGNHGKINNSAYAGASGANGYPYDYNNSSFWSDSVLAKVVSGELIEYFAVRNSVGFSNITSGVYKGEIKVTGVTKAISENKISQLIIYTNSTTDNELIDITQDGNYNIDIKGVGDANRVFFYAIPNNPNESIVVRLTEPIYIEQVGEYEGAYCLDGVDDFVTIPTTVGGKQVLMKVNWDSPNASILYDQRGYNNEFAIYNGTNDSDGNPVPAYQGRNNGQTYIDGILNSNIKTSELRAITHNITITNELSSGANKTYPIIGSSKSNAYFVNMALYDFMLFDKISTDDKILELNEYVGIEGNTE